ncbi:hypothetical protein NIES4101_45210 [Calothrix sp. NIES-4101]|nr:hypothetical protein NIES4101_45210 [Calothrix sp. NIES-4101]
MQLYTSQEIDKFQQDLPYLIEISTWVRNFLAKPHPDLGRSGKVCPYVPFALKADTIQLAVIRPEKLIQQEIEDIVRKYRDVFLQAEPTTGEATIYKVFLLIFPSIQIENTPTLIDEVQQKLKPYFVEAGMMLGEFHMRNQSPGLHNSDFRPLRSPVPILAIRFMVEQDLPFLKSSHDAPQIRIKYLETYLQRFAKKFKDDKNYYQAIHALAVAKQELIENKSSPTSKFLKCPFSSIH